MNIHDTINELKDVLIHLQGVIQEGPDMAGEDTVWYAASETKHLCDKLIGALEEEYGPLD